MRSLAVSGGSRPLSLPPPTHVLFIYASKTETPHRNLEACVLVFSSFISVLSAFDTRLIVGRAARTYRHQTRYMYTYPCIALRYGKPPRRLTFRLLCIIRQSTTLNFNRSIWGSTSPGSPLPEAKHAPKSNAPSGLNHTHTHTHTHLLSQPLHSPQAKIKFAWNNSAEAYVGNIQGGSGANGSPTPLVTKSMSVGYKPATRVVVDLFNKVMLWCGAAVPARWCKSSVDAMMLSKSLLSSTSTYPLLLPLQLSLVVVFNIDVVVVREEGASS